MAMENLDLVSYLYCRCVMQYGEYTRRSGQMSRVSLFCFGRSGNLNLAGFERWSIQTNDFNMDTCHFLAWHSAL